MPEDVRMIRVGANRVGMVGLEEVFAEVKAERIQGEDRLKSHLDGCSEPAGSFSK